MTSLSEIVLEEYRPLPAKHLQLILSEYKKRHPDLYARWESIERNLRDQEGDCLWEISLSFHTFLNASCIVKSNGAGISAFSRLRRIIGNRDRLN